LKNFRHLSRAHFVKTVVMIAVRKINSSVR